MADPLFITQLDEVTSFKDGDYAVTETTPGGTPETNYIKWENVLAQFLKRTHYQISRTISSNNVIFAIKDSDGNDATADKPLNFDIAGSIRKLTGALSLQVNAGTSVWNLGATEFANLIQELFIYIGWRASTSSCFLFVSRLPNLREVADAHTTATNERYGAASGAAPVGSDPLALLGRVNIQNSGTASFNWSIPASNQIINRPIYETNWLDWNPTLTGFSVAPTNILNRYRMGYADVSFFVRHGGNGTSNNTTLTGTLPFTAKTLTNASWGSSGTIVDNSVIGTTPGLVRVLSGATVFDVFKDMSTTAFTNANGKRLANMNVMVYERSLTS